MFSHHPKCVSSLSKPEKCVTLVEVSWRGESQTKRDENKSLKVQYVGSVRGEKVG